MQSLETLETLEESTEQDATEKGTTIAVYFLPKDEEVIRYFEKVAEDEDRSMSWVVRRALRREYERSKEGV